MNLETSSMRPEGRHAHGDAVLRPGSRRTISATKPELILVIFWQRDCLLFVHILSTGLRLS